VTEWVDLRRHFRRLRGQRVHVVAASEEARIRKGLAKAGFEVLTLAGGAVTSEATMLEEIARAFGFADDFGVDWELLADALGELALRDATRLAVVWVGADESAAADMQAFLSAVLTLDAAAAELATVDEEVDARQLEVFLLGAAGGFPGRS
jgi:RNAse (barnase) inhibitor barstar